MLDIARELVGDSAQDVRQLVLPDDPPALLHEHGVEAETGASFGSETNPPGLVVITGRKPAVPGGGRDALASGGD